jgi:PAS domain S-box-containing protein
MPQSDELMKRQQVLADFGDFAIRSDSLDAVLTEACRLVGAALGTQRAKVLEIQDGRQELLVRAGVGWAPDVVGTVRLQMSDRSSETYAIEAAAPVVMQNIAGETRFDVPPFMKDAGVVALVNVPIFVPGQRPYGVLQVDATTPREFGEDEIQFLRTYASILGPVIDRLHLVEERAAIREQLRASEVRHRLLVESWAQAVWEVDAEGVVVSDSPSWRAYTGQTIAEWLGYGWLDAIHPDDRAYAERQWRGAIAAGRLVDAEFRLRAPGGGWRWTNVRAAPVVGPDGNIEKWAGMNIDIDDRRSAQIALQERDVRLRGVLDGMAEGFAIIAPDFTILEHNREALRMDGRSRDEVVGRLHWDVYPGTEQSEVGQLLKTAMADRQPATLVHRYAFDKGEDAWLEMRVYPTAHGSLAVFWRDVTARKGAEDARRESEERYRRLFTSMDEAYAVVDVLKDDAGHWVDFRFVEVNPAFVERTSMPWPVGLTATELLGTPNPRWVELYGKALDTNRSIRVEEAEPTLGRVFGLNIFALDRARNRVAVLFTNVTERKQAEAALRASEELRRIALASGGMGAWTWNTRDRTVWADDVIQRLWGVSVSRQPHPITPYFSRMFAEGVAWLEAGMARQPEPGEQVVAQLQVANGPTAGRWIQLLGRAEHEAPWIINGVSFDITERKQSEERQQILVAELQHRTRNIMAVVSAMADTTARGSVDLAEFRLRFRDRLDALARVQGLLSRLKDHDRVTFDELIGTELAAMGSGVERTALDGPAGVRLRSSMVQTLAMALHELATNAVKYGALGQPNGRLAVTWRLATEDGAAQLRLHIDWRESGVDMSLARSMPGGGGHGRELIERALPYQLNARTSYDLGPDGVHCTLSIPVSTTALQEDADRRLDVP